MCMVFIPLYRNFKKESVCYISRSLSGNETKQGGYNGLNVLDILFFKRL